ncbi:hypothetical protein BDF14DRAFT_1724839, partial [Spinellus fusiger]
STGNDIGELQQKISQAERELGQLRLELDQTRQQAKAAELHAQESGRTNRKLKTEIQTLTDMANRKDRQAENAKATAFFFEGQVRKYTDEIETAKQGMGHLKELDDELQKAKQEQEALEKCAQEEYSQVIEQIRSTQEKYKTEKEELRRVMMEAYQELAEASNDAYRVQEEVQTRIKAMTPTQGVEELEREHEKIEKQHLETIKAIQAQVVTLQRKLDASDDSSDHEQVMVTVKGEMDRIIGRLRVIDL